MQKRTLRIADERGVALIYMSVLLTALLLFSGLAVDSGRAYVVKAALSKAVDGAALGAARTLNSGDPRGEATRIFNANFPRGTFGTTSNTDPTTDPAFFSLRTDATTGVNIVTVTANATLPTTFMRLGNFTQVTVSSSGEAQRRMVDLSLVIDVSASIGTKWSAVHDAAVTFIDSFDQAHDRLSLITFSNGASVIDPMPASRGFAKSVVESDVPVTLPGGSTNMVEGLYRGWDELRTVAAGQQSGLRIIVLFTDGASNGVPAAWKPSLGFATAVRTSDFPHIAGETANQTHDDPTVSGLSSTSSQAGTLSPAVAANSPTSPNPINVITSPSTAQTITPPAPYDYMPPTTWHSQHRSTGIPVNFPFFDNSLKVDGTVQGTARSMIVDPTNGKYKTSIWNVNNAARNVLEIVANAARNDAGGDYPIRIYTIGMGD
ncbi:MAG TPA: VWA domain-containing protein, partial [Vicinamibacterales bacterium]|nr:VWA domain-containing protein [Vicinamibacterales bacterium]